MGIKFILAVACVLFALGGAVVAKNMLADDHDHTSIVDHGGGLDKCGGHMNRKTGKYHYHRGPYC